MTEIARRLPASKRPGDGAKTTRTIAGFLGLIGVLTLALLDKGSNTLQIVLGVLSGVLISGEHIADNIRAWRGKNGSNGADPTA